MSAAQIKELVGDAERVVRTLTKADATLKAELYRTLGVRATYLSASNEVELVAAPPRVLKDVSEGGLEPPRPCGH